MRKNINRRVNFDTKYRYLVFSITIWMRSRFEIVVYDSLFSPTLNEKEQGRPQKNVTKPAPIDKQLFQNDLLIFKYV